jgi:CheY-like chemotaxis protein
MARGGFFAVDALAGTHVLVLADDSDFRDALGSLLRYCGALVTPVTSAEEALTAMDQVKPDVAVFTITGGTPSFPRQVRGRKPEDGGVIPIVAVLREGDGAAAPEGTTAHLSEPIDPWALCRMISTLVTTGG